MYWLNGVASQISLKAALTNWQQRNAEMLVENSSLVDLDGSADIVCTEASPHASLFVTCTTSTVCLWSVKVNWHSATQSSRCHFHLKFMVDIV